MMITIDPGQSFQYDFVVADNQPVGLQWVHGHVYGVTDEQTTLGLSTMFLIDGKGGVSDLKGEETSKDTEGVGFSRAIMLTSHAL